MNRKAGAAIIVLIILVIIALGLGGGTFYLFQKEIGENRKLQVQLEEIKVSMETTKAELSSSRQEISALELRLKNAQLQIETLSNDLQQEKTVKQEAMKQMDKLTLELERQKSFKLDLENKFNLAQGELQKTQMRLKELENRKVDLEQKVSDLETKSQDLQTKVSEIELGRIVVNPETAPRPQPVQAKKPVPVRQEVRQATKSPPVASPAGLEGKILVINKDYSFAVINLGSKDGVGMGSLFSVYHNNRYVGDIKVEKVHDSMAAAGFLNPDIKSKVSEGDRIVQKTR